MLLTPTSMRPTSIPLGFFLQELSFKLNASTFLILNRKKYLRFFRLFFLFLLFLFLLTIFCHKRLSQISSSVHGGLSCLGLFLRLLLFLLFRSCGITLSCCNAYVHFFFLYFGLLFLLFIFLFLLF